MRVLRVFLVSLTLAGCGAGSVQWDLPVENGMTQPARLTILPGSMGQVTMKLVAEGSYAGAYSIVATPLHPEVSTVALSAATANLDDGVPFEVRVTVTVADTAMAGDDGSVQLEAESTDGDHSALTTVIVDVGS